MATPCFNLSEDYGVPVSSTQLSDADLEGTALRTGSVGVDGSLSRTFVAAYLLTGSAQRAEQLTLESIRRLDLKAIRGGHLSWKALDAAFLEGDPGQEQTPEEMPSIPLPAELGRVLHLSRRRRHCFVLRFLMGMPRAYCAGLLRIADAEVDAHCTLAARQLTEPGH